MKTTDLKYEQVADRLAHSIEQGVYRPGERIPSVRAFSQQQAVSVSTVLQAYLLLENRGLIEARPQSGYYVRAAPQAHLPEPETSSPGPNPSQVSLNDIVTMVLRDTQNPGLAQLGAALPNLELLPIETINRLMVAQARNLPPQAHQYEFAPGFEELRVQIARRAVASGCDLGPQDIVITSGGTEAIDLCLHAVCRPGDIVAIESPTYFGTLQALELHRLRALEIPTHPREGISLGALQFALEHNPIRAVLVMPNFNNPLGSCIPDERKEDLVRLLERYDVPLIENNVYGELYFTEKAPQAAKTFDQKGLVLLCSSFSKDISPGLRVGWTAPGRYRDAVEWMKSTASVAANSLSQRVVAAFLQSAGYERHLRRIRREYARNVALMSQAVPRYFPPGTRVTRPTGGFVLWVGLPEQMDSLDLYRRALGAGITLTPGYVFSPTNQFPNFIRLNAAAWSYATERALERLGELCFEAAS